MNIHDTIEGLRRYACSEKSKVKSAGDYDAICSAIDMLLALESHDQELEHRCRQRQRVNLCHGAVHRGRRTRCSDCPMRQQIAGDWHAA